MLIKRIMKDQDGQNVDYVLIKPFGCLRILVNDLSINLSGKSGSKQVPFGVHNQNTREWPSDAGLFLFKLRFESQVHKSQVEELLDLAGLHSVK
jgi:hypothetical protein